MALQKIDGFFVKDGFYLEPIGSVRIDQASYQLPLKILRDRYALYKNQPPLLMPLMRGGSRCFLNLSGSFRRVLRNDSQNIDYIPIKVSRYNPTEIGSQSVLKIDESDIMEAYYALQRHSDGIIIDDVFDKGHSTDGVKKLLLPSGKPIIIATLYRKPEENQTDTNADYWVEDFSKRTLGGKSYTPWLVFPWEIDDHDPETWAQLFPEFADLHPELMLP